MKILTTDNRLRNTSDSQGITMIELLIVVVILAVLLIMALFGWRTQWAKAKDAQRKSELEKIRLAFEDYFNDKECYPPVGSLENCGSDDLAPYLKEIWCDPVTGEPYEYEPLANCRGYRIYTKLVYDSDPVIEELGCDTGCGTDGTYNYGIAVGTNLETGTGTTPTGSPTPTPSPTPSGSPYQGKYACAPPDNGSAVGECNDYGTIERLSGPPWNCPYSFATTDCDNRCGDSNYWCER